MDQHIELAMKDMNCGNFGQLCREHGISRKTGYKWRERFVARGLEGMAEDVVCRIVRLKQAHPAWGPRKIRKLYRPQHTDALPSESSFKRVLERCGLTQRRVRRAARQSGRLATGRQAQQPNDVWSVDSKGWWHDGRGQRVEPSRPSSKSSRRRRGSPWPLRPTPLRSIDLRVQGRRRLPQINRKHVTPNPKCVTHVLNLKCYLCIDCTLHHCTDHRLLIADC